MNTFLRLLNIPQGDANILGSSSNESMVVSSPSGHSHEHSSSLSHPQSLGRSGSAGARFLPINRKSIDLGPGGTGSDDREHDEDEDDGYQVLLF